MEQKLGIFRQRAVDSLKRKLEVGELEIYSQSKPDWEDYLGMECWLETSIPFNGAKLAEAMVLPRKDAAASDADPEDEGIAGDDDLGDIANAKSVYLALEHLTPQQAADERVWIALTHAVLWDYARSRWPLRSSGEELKRFVRLHYFLSSSNRGLVRDNAISRLWWMGYVAHRSNLGIDQALEVLLYRTDVRANLLERPSLAASPEIFNGIMQALSESYYEDNDRKLFERGLFRECMKALNRIGGRRMLNVLGPARVYKLIKKHSG